MTARLKETELKLQASRESLRDLQSHPKFRDLLKAPIREQTLISVYFDSERFDLRNHGINLRVRQIGDQKIQTVKIINPTTGLYFERAEFEQEIAGDLPDLGFAADSPLRPLLTDELRKTIKPIFETRIERKSYQIHGEEADIEMVLDDGQIIAGNSRLPVSEIELELKRGNPAELLKLARSINSVVPAQLAVRSKSERGYDLIKQRKLTAEAAGKIILAGSLTSAQAFKLIAHSCLHHIVANQAAVISLDAKGLHQIRIALRRLRVAISVFSDIVQDDQVDMIKAELKRFGQELGRARDVDVLLSQVLRPFARSHPRESGFVSLRRSFGRERSKAYQYAVEAIGSDVFRKFVIDCAVWIEAGAWTNRTDFESVERARRPVTLYAAGQISKHRKKCRKLGRIIAKLNTGELHELRIRLKKLRYAAEFFESLYTDHKSAKRFGRLVLETRGLQDILGAINDATTRRGLFTDMMVGQRRVGSRQRAFAAGLIVGQQEAQLPKLMKGAVKAFAKLETVRPFWKGTVAPDGNCAFANSETQACGDLSKVA